MGFKTCKRMYVGECSVDLNFQGLERFIAGWGALSERERGESGNFSIFSYLLCDHLWFYFK